MTDLTKFNRTLEEFIDALADVYENHPKVGRDLIIFREKFALIKGINPRLPLEQFIKHVVPHKAKILEQDEQFFIELDVKKTAKNENSVFQLLRIQEMWQTENNDQIKTTIWTYFKVLVILAEKAMMKYMEAN